MQNPQNIQRALEKKTQVGEAYTTYVQDYTVKVIKSV